MFDQHLSQSWGGVRTRPIALKLCLENHPGDRNGASLDHPLNRHLVGFEADAAGSVSNDVNLVTVAQILDGGHREAYLSPQRSHNNFLPACLPNPVQDAGILPGVDERAVNRLLVWKNILKRLEKVTTLAFEHRRKQRRHAEDLRRFGEAYNVVDDRLCVMTAKAGELECLMVNQEQRAVVGREQGLEAVF